MVKLSAINNTQKGGNYSQSTSDDNKEYMPPGLNLMIAVGNQ